MSTPSQRVFAYGRQTRLGDWCYSDTQNSNRDEFVCDEDEIAQAELGNCEKMPDGRFKCNVKSTPVKKSRRPYPNITCNTGKFGLYDDQVGDNNTWAECDEFNGTGSTCCRCSSGSKVFSRNESQNNKSCVVAGETQMCCWPEKLPYIDMPIHELPPDMTIELARYNKLEPSNLSSKVHTFLAKEYNAMNSFYRIVILDVPRDGDCFYHAIAMAFNSGMIDNNTGVKYNSAVKFKTVSDLRSMVASVVNATNFEAFQQIYMDEAPDWAKRLYNVKSHTALRKVIMSNSHYAIWLDAAILAHRLGVNIVAFLQMGRFFIPSLKRTQAECQQLPSILVFNADGHYQLLVCANKYTHVYQAMFFPADISNPNIYFQPIEDRINQMANVRPLPDMAKIINSIPDSNVVVKMDAVEKSPAKFNTAAPTKPSNIKWIPKGPPAAIVIDSDDDDDDDDDDILFY